jgi:hypothetical protein
MAGQHIEREARWAATGMTQAQRDKLIWEWHNRGVPYSKIGQHLGMSKSAVKYRFDALNGRPRQQRQVDMCQGCWDGFYRDQLTNGLCPKCSTSAAEKPPPSEQW